MRLEKTGQRMSLVLKLYPVWHLHLYTPLPDNIPYPTPYPLDNWLSPGQFFHTHPHTHTYMTAHLQSNQTSQTNALLLETMHLFLAYLL